MEMWEEESKIAENKGRKKVTMKEEKELQKFWNNWKTTDKKTKSARGMKPARRKEPASGMESARGMELQRQEAGTTEDDMKPVDKMQRIKEGNR